MRKYIKKTLKNTNYRPSNSKKWPIIRHDLSETGRGLFGWKREEFWPFLLAKIFTKYKIFDQSNIIKYIVFSQIYIVFCEYFCKKVKYICIFWIFLQGEMAKKPPPPFFGQKAPHSAIFSTFWADNHCVFDFVF